MNRKPQPRADLQRRIGHDFATADLLEQALTHSSALAPSRRIARSYQRLEFLGDRVLGLVVADLLLRQMPDANEGGLSRGLNALVRKESCALVARRLNLGPEINVGEAEARSGGAEKEAILADVCEALIGAIYLDGGLEAAYAFVAREFGAGLKRGDARRADAKTTLQEWAQAKGLNPPDYVEVARSGPDHQPHFTIAVDLAGYDRVAASGASKKVAEHKAAEQFLIAHNVWSEPD